MLDNVATWQRRSHTVKVGFSWSKNTGHHAEYGNTGGTFNFSSTTTGIPGQPFSSRVGSSFASFLLGLVNDASVGVPYVLDARRYYASGFAQDNWKVSGRLTLNIGLRWSGNSPIYEANDTIAWFNPALPDTGANNLLGAVEYMGSGPGRSGRQSWTNGAWMDFAPTFGFAYRLKGSTVLRGGYGISFTPENIANLTGWSSVVPAGFVGGLRDTNSAPANSKGIYLPVFNLDDGYQGAATPAAADPAW